MEHEAIDTDSLAPRDAYRLMTDIIAPRPIAWVSTLDADGRGNLAPFSYFQGVCSRPPTVILGVGWHSDGRPKDTLRNILDRREFTICHVAEAVAESMNETAADYPPNVSEWEIAAAGAPLPTAPARRVAPPRVADAAASLECKLVHAIPIGHGKTGNPSSTLVVGEVLCFTVAAGVLQRDDRGHLLATDPARLAAVGRLGGIAYTRTRQTFELVRPKVD